MLDLVVDWLFKVYGALMRYGLYEDDASVWDVERTLECV